MRGIGSSPLDAGSAAWPGLAESGGFVSSRAWIGDPERPLFLLSLTSKAYRLLFMGASAGTDFGLNNRF